jgi:hypothetical protein
MSKRPSMTGARTLLAQMQAEEDRVLIETRLALDGARRGASVALWGTGGLGTILLVLVVYLTRRDEANLHRAERELATTLRSIGDGGGEVLARAVGGAARGRPLGIRTRGAHQLVVRQKILASGYGLSIRAA